MTALESGCTVLLCSVLCLYSRRQPGVAELMLMAQCTDPQEEGKCVQEGTMCASLSVTLCVCERKREGKGEVVFGHVAFISYHISELVLPFFCLTVPRCLSSCCCSTTSPFFPTGLCSLHSLFSPLLHQDYFFIVKQQISSSTLSLILLLSFCSPLSASSSLPHPPLPLTLQLPCIMTPPRS